MGDPSAHALGLDVVCKEEREEQWMSHDDRPPYARLLSSRRSSSCANCYPNSAGARAGGRAPIFEKDD
jgi:hypothetical protein